MRTRIFSERDVHELLTYRECIDVMREAFIALANGEVFQPLRNVLRPPNAPGFFGLMPAYRGGERAAFGLKAVCVIPQNPARGLDTHVGVVILSDGETGEVISISNAAAITAIRTAAVSALATDVLARPDAETLAVIGTGAQARSHLAALLHVRPFRRVLVSGRSIEAAEHFIRQSGVTDVPCTAAETREAVESADVIVTATNSREPILEREWLRPGVHVNAVGSSVESARELDSQAVAASSLFVDWRESTENESGDYLFALREKAITDRHIRATLGDVLTGRHPGRTSRDEITLFKSLGLAIEDLAAAAFITERGRALNRGIEVEL